jgi:hypothetical protein
MALETRLIAFLIDILSLSVVGKETGMALGSLCIVAGIIFLIDFFFAVRVTRITYVQASVLI